MKARVQAADRRAGSTGSASGRPGHARSAPARSPGSSRCRSDQVAWTDGLARYCRNFQAAARCWAVALVKTTRFAPSISDSPGSAGELERCPCSGPPRSRTPAEEVRSTGPAAGQRVLAGVQVGARTADRERALGFSFCSHCMAWHGGRGGELRGAVRGVDWPAVRGGELLEQRLAAAQSGRP